MRLGGWVYLLAALVLVGGVAFALRQRTRRMRVLMLFVTFLLAAVIGWLAWLSTSVAMLPE